MLRYLTNEQYTDVREALTGSDGDKLCMSIFDLALGKQPRGGNEHIDKLRELNWYDNDCFTEIGILISDPIREFGFWIERDKALPSEECVPILSRQRFKSKRVLELGSGGGCNLFSLTNIPEQLVGLEPMPIYRQMTPILAEIAGLPTPTVIEAFAEDIPIDNKSFDIILCYTSHQYMDIDKALSEMARLLDTNGCIIIVGYTFYHFMIDSYRRFVHERSLGIAKYDAISLLNTIHYEAFGRRLTKGQNWTTTSTPVYPSRRYMERKLNELGLTIDQHETCTVGSGETILVANSMNN